MYVCMYMCLGVCMLGTIALYVPLTSEEYIHVKNR